MEKYFLAITIFMILSYNCQSRLIGSKTQQNNGPIFPKIVWTYSQAKNVQSVLTKIGKENMKIIKQNWEFRYLDRSNADQFLNQIPQYEKMLRFPQYTENNKPIIQIDLIRIALLKHFGGIFIDFDTILTQPMQWIKDLKIQAFINNKQDNSPQIFLFDNSKNSQQILYHDQKTNNNVLLYPSFQTYFLASQKQSVFLQQWFDYYAYVKDISYQKYKNSQKSWFMDLANQYSININQIKSKYRESIICAEVLLKRKQIQLDKLWKTNKNQKYRKLAVSFYKLCNINKDQITQLKQSNKMKQQSAELNKFNKKIYHKNNYLKKTQKIQNPSKFNSNKKQAKQNILIETQQIFPQILFVFVQICLLAFFVLVYYEKKQQIPIKSIKISTTNNQVFGARSKDELQYQNFPLYYQQQKKQKKNSNSQIKKCFKIGIFFISFILFQTGFFGYYNSSLQKYVQTAKYVQTPIIKQTVKKVIIQKQKQSTNKVAKIFPATVKLNYNYQSETQPVTVVFTCSGGRYKLFQDTLRSFFTNNTYPVRQILAVDDDYYSQQFGKFMNKFPNITFILTNLRVGQFYAVDLAYKYIKTQYYFHSQEDFDFIRPGFIQKSLQIMTKQPKISQVVLRSWGNATEGPQGTVDPKKSLFSAFSFNPSIKRMSQYHIFEQKFGGFSEFLSFKSFGTGAGNTQGCISYYLLKQGYIGYHLNDTYAVHIGEKNGLKKYVFGDKAINCESIIPH